MAMGGTGVAIAQGLDAQYYNPALLTSTKEYEEDIVSNITFGALGHFKPSGITNPKDELYTKYKTKTDADAGVGFKKGGLTLGVRSLSSLITARAGTTQNINADLGIFTEVALGYGFEPIRGINLGGNIKVIEGIMGEYSHAANTWGVGFGGLMKELWCTKEYSTSWGIDLGAAVNLSKLFNANVLFDPTIAIVGKNLNRPSFKRSKNSHWSEKEYRMDKQVRVGAAIHPFTDRVTITGDYDLTESNSIVKDYKSRQLSGGIEIMAINRHTFKLPIRLGVNQDREDDDIPTYFTAGFGTQNTEYAFDFAVAFSNEADKINANYFPTVMGVSMSFTWVF